MQRIPEPELMEDIDQAAAYANADFEEPHNQFIEEFKTRFPGLKVNGPVLDLGCGPADITIRFAKAFPECHIDGIDGSEAMLAAGKKAVAAAGLKERIRLFNRRLPTTDFPRQKYPVIISNSLLHHLHDPAVLWDAVLKVSEEDTTVFIMDLMRPDSETEAARLVDEYAAGEPEVLQRDFYHSLCAAFLPEEVEEQMQRAGLRELRVEIISDRHIIVFG